MCLLTRLLNKLEVCDFVFIKVGCIFYRLVAFLLILNLNAIQLSDS